ncbi:MAG: phosphatidate cytidylyltransferase [Prevotellaceae bacterium]|jgi:phosphatidate cytidylyltransferase|nr:phosphatidate cytidylyltransferase [Prevotellaceae bacterium]
MKNFITRTISGTLFLAIMIGAILWSVHAFWILSCIIVVLGMIEFFKMTIPKGHELQKIISIFIGLSVLLLMSVNNVFDDFQVINLLFGIHTLIILIVGLFTVIPIVELYEKSEKPFHNISLLILPIIYVALPFALMNLCYSEGHNLYILAFFIFIWTNDVGAYCFGMLFGQHGKHKFFPRISPKKTWEGFIGGIITVIIAGVLISKFMFDGNNMHHWIIIAIITSVLGTFGDLVESMMKRSAGVKDSGKIMPGHGGILDRFDAVLLSFPTVFTYIFVFNLYSGFNI